MTEITQQVFDQLTAAGSTDGFEAKHFKNHSFQLVIANINTNVIVRAEGSLDEDLADASWFNLDDTESNTTYTANGTYLMHKSNTPLNWVRFTIVSESGGATVTVNVIYKGTN